MKLRLLLIGILLVSLTLGIAVQAQDEELEAELQAVLENYVAEDGPGVVVYVSSPDFTWIGARGLANLEAGTPVQTSDRFRIGSITKPFVGALVMQLVDEGLVSLDEPMSKYLSEDIVQNIINGDEITVRQLLNMTSGIFNYTESDDFFAAVESDPTHAWTAEETVAYAYGQEPYFAPGEGYYYSNTNYNLLEIIIQNATDSTLAEQMQTRILEPLGMSNSYIEPPTNLGDGIVRGYTNYGDGLQDVTEFNEGNGLGDGGIISTAEELALFPRALLGGELMSEDALEEMLNMVDDGEGGLYGLGIGEIETEWGTGYGHSGATAGFQSDMVYFPDYELAIVALTNDFTSENLEPLMSDIIDLTLEALE